MYALNIQFFFKKWSETLAQLLDKRKWTWGCVSHLDGMLLCESTYIYLFFASNILTASFMKDSMNECAKTHR